MFDGVSYLCKASKKKMGNSWTKAYTDQFSLHNKENMEAEHEIQEDKNYAP